MARFVHITTFTVTEKEMDLGMIQDPTEVEIAFNPLHVAYVQKNAGKTHDGCEIGMVSGEVFYTDTSMDAVMKMIEQELNYGLHPRSN